MNKDIPSYKYQETLKVVRQLVTDDALRDSITVFLEIYGVGSTLNGFIYAIEDVIALAKTDKRAEQLDQLWHGLNGLLKDYQKNTTKGDQS